MDTCFHIIPVNDIVEHQESKQCPCVPRVELGYNEYGEEVEIVVHNAWDQRELAEDCEGEC